MRSAEIRLKDIPAGILREEPDGYSFTYDKEYLAGKDSHPISLSFPLMNDPQDVIENLKQCIDNPCLPAHVFNKGGLRRINVANLAYFRADLLPAGKF